MKTTVIYLIRHGELDNPQGVVYGRTLDIGLSEEGKVKIATAGERIKEQEGEIDAIYTSPLRRSVESATIISKVMRDAPVFKDELLTETDVPAIVGKPITIVEELEAKGEDMYREDFIHAGNESREHVAERMVKAYQKITTENMGKKIVVVGHGDPLCILFYRFTHKEGPIPIMAIVKRKYYPQKGEGWKMVLDEKGNTIETTFVTGEN